MPIFILRRFLYCSIKPAKYRTNQAISYSAGLFYRSIQPHLPLCLLSFSIDRRCFITSYYPLPQSWLQAKFSRFFSISRRVQARQSSTRRQCTSRPNVSASDRWCVPGDGLSPPSCSLEQY